MLRLSGSAFVLEVAVRAVTFSKSRVGIEPCNVSNARLNAVVASTEDPELLLASISLSLASNPNCVIVVTTLVPFSRVSTQKASKKIFGSLGHERSPTNENVLKTSHRQIFL